ncbi:MAG: class I SAM-dependent methyltransferase, partial [Candidatus Eremiobacterota bacterium]
SRLGATGVTGIDVMKTVGCGFPDKKIEYIMMNGQHLKFPDETFDLSFTIATLEHVKDPFKVLMELKRITAPGGYSYIQVGPLYHSPFGHHMFEYYNDYPWIHILLDLKGLMEFTRHKGIDKIIQRDKGGNYKDYIRAMMSRDHINGLFLKDYRIEEFMAQKDIEVLRYTISYEGKELLTPLIKKELPHIDPGKLVEHGFELIFKKL